MTLMALAASTTPPAGMIRQAAFLIVLTSRRLLA
jgi:hypothetical protein